jgi:hypothetical protein
VAFPLGGGRSIQLSYGDNGAHYMQKIALRSSGYPRALENAVKEVAGLGCIPLAVQGGRNQNPHAHRFSA